MPSRKELILTRLADEGRKTAAYFRALTPAELAQTVYTAGPGWRAQDLITHIASAERNIARLVADILAGGPGAPEGFDIDAFNAAETAARPAPPMEDRVRDFEAARAATLALVASAAEADLDRQGRHPFLGITSVDAMLKLLYRHTMLHERDARKAIETGAPLAGAV